MKQKFSIKKLVIAMLSNERDKIDIPMSREKSRSRHSFRRRDNRYTPL